LAGRDAGLAAFFVAALALSSIVFVQIPGHASALTPGAGQEVLSDPARPVIYWAGAAGNDLKFINSSTGGIIDSIIVGDGPSSICLSPDGTTLYVALPQYKCVIVVDADSHSITGNISLSFFPLSVRLDGKGFMYASGTNDNAGWLYSVDMHNWKVKDSVAPGWGRLVIEVSPDGTTLLAMHLESSPVKVYKYGINAGVFAYLDVDNHDLGSNLQYEVVDWAKGKIYLASGAPYGIELVSIATLDNLGMYSMASYPSCVALSSDGGFIYGTNEQGSLWMFNATDGNLMGTMYLGMEVRYLAIAPDLENIFVGLPIKRISLTPQMGHRYPSPDSAFGYTPHWFSIGLVGGVPHYDGTNATAYVDLIPLSLHLYDTFGDWTYYEADFGQVLSEGIHTFSVALPWMDRILWGNSTFVIDRHSQQVPRPALHPEYPYDGSIQLSEELLTITARIVYSSSERIVQGGWIRLDGDNLSTAFTTERLSVNYGPSPSLGWHNVSAYIYWDGGLGKAWANWSFLVMQGPILTPIYPAKNQVLSHMPDHIEVAIDYRDTGGNVSAPQLFLDYIAIPTTLTQNHTIFATIPPLARAGTHNVQATLNWEGGKAALTWQFDLDMFIGPAGETLVRYEYKDEFSMLVPHGESWSLEEDAELAGQSFPLVLYGPTFGDFRTNVIVESAADSAVEESEAYLQGQLDQAIDELEQSGIDVIMLGAPELRTVDNHTAYIATIQLEGYSVYQEIAIIASEAHEMVWVIILSTNAYKFSEYNEMFNDMLNSFKIELRLGSIWSILEQEAVGLGIASIVGGTAGIVVWTTRKRRGSVALRRP
jgi:DNA-binding beta-propeller fold protein YncE